MKSNVAFDAGSELHLFQTALGSHLFVVDGSRILVSPDPTLTFSTADFELFLEKMIACGEKAVREITAGRAYPL